MEILEKKCLRPGCGKKYTDETNTDTSCNFHDGKPIFHDIKKGWTCCNKLVYDWDEFQKLVGCQSGKHSDVKQEAQFFKSNTVSNAQAGLDKQNNPQQISMPTKVATKSIEDHEKEQKIKDEEKKKAEMEKPKVLVVIYYFYLIYLNFIRKIKMGKYFVPIQVAPKEYLI